MKYLDKRLRAYTGQYPLPSCREERIAETVVRSQDAFYEHETERPVSGPEFLLWQSRYIRKRWWVLQGLLLAVLWYSVKQMEGGPYAQRTLGALTPFFVLLIMPELWKNRMAEAVEIECTTCYSLRQIYAARMILFALVDFLMVSVFLAVASFTVQMKVTELIVQFFIPLNVTCCICFRTLYGRRSGSEVFALFLCAFLITLWVRLLLADEVYDAISFPAWGTLLLGSALWLCYCVRKIWNHCEEIWEAEALWN